MNITKSNVAEQIALCADAYMAVRPGSRGAAEIIKDQEYWEGVMQELQLTDEQIDAVTDAQWGAGCSQNQYMAHRTAARAYIRAAIEPVLDLIDECPGLTMEQDSWLTQRVKAIAK